MPLPIGHALAGIAFFQTRPGLFFKNKWLDAVFFVFLANLPDADFLPGLLLGFPNLYHHGIFHSLGAALAVSAAISCLFFRKKNDPGDFSPWFFSSFIRTCCWIFLPVTSPHPTACPFSGPFPTTITLPPSCFPQYHPLRPFGQFFFQPVQPSQPRSGRARNRAAGRPGAPGRNRPPLAQQEAPAVHTPADGENGAWRSK